MQVDLGLIPGMERSSGERNKLPTPVFLGFPGGSDGKESTCNAEDLGWIPGVGKVPRREWLPTSVFLPGESPWTEEPGGLRTTGLHKSRTQLRD